MPGKLQRVTIFPLSVNSIHLKINKHVNKNPIPKFDENVKVSNKQKFSKIIKKQAHTISPQDLFCWRKNELILFLEEDNRIERKKLPVFFKISGMNFHINKST